MAGMMIMMKVLFVTVACMVLVTAPYTEAAIDCGQVVSKLMSCLPYLQSGGNPSVWCCTALKDLNSAAQTTPDRQAACNCMKTASKSYPSINHDNFASLPGKCGINLPYKISPNTDCSTVK